jgi:hypothetical protein
MTDNYTELAACKPMLLNPNGFNPDVKLPYDLTSEHIKIAMQDFLEFLGFINVQLNTKKILRLESIIMQANFSSIVGEFIKANIPTYCPTLVKNQYHNGHPDLIPINTCQNDSIQHGDIGVEIKSSRYSKGWQGHNPENTWLMVFVYDSNSPEDKLPLRPFRFKMVLGAEITKEDWTFSGRSATSRRTITASVNKSGYEKMYANWIYKDSTL